MGAPGGGRPGADWTAAYIIIGVGVPVGWAIAVAAAVILERRAARRGVSQLAAATIAALSDMRTYRWHQESEDRDLEAAGTPTDHRRRRRHRRRSSTVVASGGVSRGSSSLDVGSTYVDDAAADPGAEELVEMQAAAGPAVEELAEMQRAQNAWVSESQQQHQYKTRAEMHRVKVRQQLGRPHEAGRAVGRSLTSGSSSSSEPQQNRPRHYPAHESDQHTPSPGRRHERQDGRANGGGGYDSDDGSSYSTDTVRPGATSRSGAQPDAGGSARHHERHAAAGPDAGSSRSGNRERARTPASPPPQPKSSFPATRRDWRPSGDGGAR